MTRTYRWLELCRFLLLSALVIVAVKLAFGQRVLREGDTWLKWSREAQKEYVWGFSAGYAGGYERACRQMDALWNGPRGLDAENDPLRKCFAKEAVLSRGPDFYADALTKFYERYPGDRDLMIGEVLEKLAQGLTIAQIHRYPFPRHSASPLKN